MRDNFKTRFKNDFNYICALAIMFAALGWIVENTFRLITKGVIDNRFHFLPFIPVYGFIAFAAYIIGNPDDEFFFGYKLTKSKFWSNIIYILLIASGVTFGELAVGNLWEICSGAELWNYNNIPLHWTQYTSLPTTLGFTAGGYLILKFGYYPLLNMLKERFSQKQAFGATIFYGILLIDMIHMMIVTAVKGEGQVYWQVNVRDGSIGFPMILDFIIFGVFNVYFILFLVINGRYFSKKKIVIPVHEKKAYFAVLIPVEKDIHYILDALNSINKADYPKDKIDVFISLGDNINWLREKYKTNDNFRFIETDNGLSSADSVKLMVEEILSLNNDYDSIIILQDDNIIDRDFFLRMSDATLEGYDVVSANKDNRNWHDSKVSASAGLMYLANNHINNMKSKISEAVRPNESGYAIKYELIKSIGKWPFDNDAEDAELEKYVENHKLSSIYQHEAVFYDTNPVTTTDFINERTNRFKELIKNFKSSKKKDLSNIVTCGLVIHFLFFIIYNMLLTIFGFFTDIDSHQTFKYVIISLVAYYVVIFVYSLVILILDKKNTISAKGILKQALFHPIFLFTYVISFLKALKKS